MTDVVDHYSTGGPYERVMAALDATAPNGAPLSLGQLGGFDEFHTGGQFATDRLATLVSPSSYDVVLDAGCGVGGPARYLADRFGCHVIGVDLTPEFVAIARHLNERTDLTAFVDVRLGDITALDLDDDSVDVVWTQHVSMNVPDKAAMYREFARVLRPGGRLALYDIVAGAGDLHFPVPWATGPAESHLVTPDELGALLVGAGFTIEEWHDPTEPMLVAVRTRLEEIIAAPPSETTLGMHTYLADLPTRVGTYVRNTEEGRTGVIMAIGRLAAP